MKVTMTEAICPEGMALLEGKAEIFVAHDARPHNYLDQLKDTDAFIVRVADKGAIDKETMESSTSLKVIGRTGVGYDSVDVESATKLGIPVVITPGANNRSVAEHAVAMMFALSKNMVEAQNEMCAGNWKIRDAKKAFEVEGKTVGIIGLGAIGRETAKICQGCGMKVAGYDPFLPQDKIEALGAAYYADYEELLKVSDIVTIHVPLTEETRNMIAKPQLDMMKKTSIIINCSRGGIINEEDLVQALKDGTIAGAGTDVYCSEPPKTDDPMLNCPNLIVSPHSAAQTREAVIKMAQMCVTGCLAICNGEKWPYVADKTVYDHPIWEGKPWAQP